MTKASLAGTILTNHKIIHTHTHTHTHPHTHTHTLLFGEFVGDFNDSDDKIQSEITCVLSFGPDKGSHEFKGRNVAFKM